MQKLLAAAFASAALLSAPAARADEDSAAYQIRVQSTNYKLAPQEFNEYAYRYLMSTGDSLQLRQSVGRYFAKLNDGAEVEIYGQKPGVFQASTGTRLEFRDAGEHVLLTGAGALPGASPALAALPADSVQVAGR